MRSNVRKHAKICNFKQQSLRREYFLFQKHIFLKFRRIRTIAASDQNLVKEKYLKVKLSQFCENWKNFRNQGIINLS